MTAAELLAAEARYRAEAEELGIDYATHMANEIARHERALAAGRNGRHDVLSRAPHANGPSPAGGAKRPRVTAADLATVADLKRAGAAARWAWQDWLGQGVVNALAAPGGTGKTRFCFDLLRRIRLGLPWPDGRPMTLPPDTRSLWMLADNHHDQFVDESEKFGVADVVRVSAWKSEPYAGVSLDTVDDYLWLDECVDALRPALVFVDTVGNSTDRNLSRQEDAKGYYQPLQVLARKYATAVVCVTHLNAAGQFLGRRVLEKVRVAIQLQKFKGEERLRLEVKKSVAKHPPALGVTMGTGKFDYDDHPPEPPDESGGGGSAPAAAQQQPASRLGEMCDWLRAALKNGRRQVFELRNDAEEAGFSSSTLYAARRRLQLEETEGANGRKWWGLENDVGGRV